MALADAILSLADELDQDANDLLALGSSKIEEVRALRRYARQLRTAVKAAEGSAPFQPSPAVSPTVQHAQEIEKERRKIRKEKAEKGLAEEGLGPDGVANVILAGGPLDGVSIDCPANIAFGCRTNIGGAVYQFREDGRAHFDEEATKALSAVRDTPKSGKLIVP